MAGICVFAEGRNSMRRLNLTVAGAMVFACGLGLTAQTPATRTAAPQPKPALVVAHAPAGPSAEAQTALVKQYCAGCHS